MFNAEIRKLLIEVISSWQVLTVTIILIIYVFIVNNVARIYHNPRRREKPFIPKAKPETTEAPAGSAEQDELELEEEEPETPKKKGRS